MRMEVMLKFAQVKLQEEPFFFSFLFVKLYGILSLQSKDTYVRSLRAREELIWYKFFY